MKKHRELPVAPFERVSKNAGAERTSEAALVELRDAVEDYAEALAKKSAEYAKHAGRKTIKADDVRLALK
jgi:histone H3/H4